MNLQSSLIKYMIVFTQKLMVVMPAMMASHWRHAGDERSDENPEKWMNDAIRMYRIPKTLVPQPL